MRTYETLCLYVQENFQHELTRESVAQRFEIAPAHVSRLFRREGLMRFSDYVNLVRMNRAKFILANYRIPLKEVAASCGYADVAYFCRVFKRFAKATPGTVSGSRKIRARPITELHFFRNSPFTSGQNSRIKFPPARTPTLPVPHSKIDPAVRRRGGSQSVAMAQLP